MKRTYLIGALILIFALSVTVWAEQNIITNQPCVGGFADIYPCSNVDLLAYMPIDTIGGGRGADLWGWEDDLTGKEYALMGRDNGIAFVDVSDPTNPAYVGELPTNSPPTASQRDVKVLDEYAFIVSESLNHGMQIFDLTQLRGLTSTVTFTHTALYTGFLKAHNIFIDETTRYAYGIDTNPSEIDGCNKGLFFMNIDNPLNPIKEGCFAEDGFTHDAQCIVYDGPDTDYSGQEICFNANADTLTIADVTDKANPIMVSRTPYTGSQFAHQGWLTEDRAYFLMNDEADEAVNGHNTRTYFWDVRDLDAPFVDFTYTADVPSIDHNLYVQGNYAYLANYTSGLRVLDLTGIDTGNVVEVAYFDVFPANDNVGFDGAWTAYPFFESGILAVSAREGLFLLQMTTVPTGVGMASDASTNSGVTATNQTTPLVLSLALLSIVTIHITTITKKRII